MILKKKRFGEDLITKLFSEGSNGKNEEGEKDLKEAIERMGKGKNRKKA